MISSGARYAIRAMLFIAHNTKDVNSVTTREISQRKKIPRVFLSKIIERLVHEGLLVSYRGASGGVALAIPAEKITLRQIIEAVDGPVVGMPCLVRPDACLIRPEECACDVVCPANKAWLSVHTRFIELLDSHTLASMECIK